MTKEQALEKAKDLVGGNVFLQYFSGRMRKFYIIGKIHPGEWGFKQELACGYSWEEALELIESRGKYMLATGKMKGTRDA